MEYQLSDHLGNVRVVFRRGEGGIAERLGYADYYPMGMVLPGRQEVSANGYRYGYQGEYAEKTGETGWNDFELRSYDSRIGRWMTIDPAYVHFSPYLGMANRWPNTTDPTGGIPWCENRETGEVKWFETDQDAYNAWGNQDWVNYGNFHDWQRGATNYHGEGGGKITTESAAVAMTNSVDANFAFAGGGGVEIGVLTLENGDSRIYVTKMANMGGYFSAGYNAGIIYTTNGQEFGFSTFEGNGFGASGGLPGVGFGVSTNANGTTPNGDYYQYSGSTGPTFGLDLGGRIFWSNTSYIGGTFNIDQKLQEFQQRLNNLGREINYQIFKYQ